MAKKRKRPPALVPRLGPPVNLRPAGAHGDVRRKTRSDQLKAALRDEAAFDRFGPAKPRAALGLCR